MALFKYVVISRLVFCVGTIVRILYQILGFATFVRVSVAGSCVYNVGKEFSIELNQFLEKLSKLDTNAYIGTHTPVRTTRARQFPTFRARFVRFSALQVSKNAIPRARFVRFFYIARAPSVRFYALQPLRNAISRAFFVRGIPFDDRLVYET